VLLQAIKENSIVAPSSSKEESSLSLSET
jgi:hypothetical protein